MIGFATLKAVFESLFGPLGVQPLASHVYGLYTGLVYLTPILGGLIADRWLGQRRTVVLGAALMALGHFMMAYEPLFLFALFVLILGNGAFKPNISTQVGTLYAPGDPRRDRAFSIFYVGINLGAFLAPLVCGTLGEALRLALRLRRRRRRHDPRACRSISSRRARCRRTCAATRIAAGDTRPFGRDEWRAIVALCVLFVPVTFFWATYEQAGNTIALWADGYADRSVLGLFTIPVTWFQAFNPFMIFAFTPFIIALWSRQAMARPRALERREDGLRLLLCRGRQPHHGRRRGFGGGTATASWLWLLAYFVVLTIGELYISPTSLSLVTKVAPARIVSMMMGVWLATSFTGNLAAGYLGSFWSGMGKSDFFMMIAIIAALAGLAVLAVARPINRILKV